MAEKQGQHADPHPSEVNAVRMAVIECRKGGSSGWEVRETPDWQTGAALNRTCRRHAEDFPQYEFRWRYGWLRLDPSDNCEIFKSE